MTDALAVTSTIAAALQASDRRDLAAQDRLWTVDARGRDAILPVGEVASFMTGTTVQFDGDGRADVSYRLFLAAKGDHPGVPPAYDCRDQLRRVDGQWRIAARSVEPFTGDVMAVIDGLAAQIG